MRKIVIMGIVLMGISYFYCAPQLIESYVDCLMMILSGLVFIYGFYFVIRYLIENNKLKNSKKTYDFIIYFSYFLVIIYSFITFGYLIIMIFTKEFRFAGNILPTIFSIDCSRRIKKIIMNKTYMEQNLQ